MIVPWHTGDYGLDQIYPNSDVCPRLDSVQDVALSSPLYQAENTSNAMVTLTNTLDTIFGAGYWDWDHVFDCLMTTVCTGNSVPDGMNDVLFNATIAQAEFTYAYFSLYNDSQWSKLAMGNTAWHVRNNLQSAVQYNSSASNSTSAPPLKLALFAGHDTTIMPFLAAVLADGWDRMWAGYAALVTIELYEAAAGDASYWFRLVYNGKPQVLPGCNDTLCDVAVLLQALSFGQQYMPCSIAEEQASEAAACQDSSSSSSSRLSDGDVILIAFMSALLGGLLGAAGFVFMEKYRASKLSAEADHLSQAQQQQQQQMSPMSDLDRW